MPIHCIYEAKIAYILSLGDFSTFQNLSPNLSLLNWSPTMHWKVGPSSAPGAGFSIMPPWGKEKEDRDFQDRL